MLNQGIWLLLYQSCLTKHNAEDWCNPKVAKSLPTTFYHSIRYMCINQIRNNWLSAAKIIELFLYIKQLQSDYDRFLNETNKTSKNKTYDNKIITGTYLSDVCLHFLLYKRTIKLQKKVILFVKNCLSFRIFALSK